MSLAHLRKEYTLAGLRRRDLDADPVVQFGRWLQEAIDAGAAEPTAMTLATCDATGQPSSRTVLLKGLDERGFLFFTNYESRKGRELAGNPRAALTFHWKELERQVCVCGAATKVSREESEAYFQSRPAGSRLAAWVSRQTEVISGREHLEKELAVVTARFGDAVPLPPYWGGLVVSPISVEFWQGRPNRLHDRFLYERKSGGPWTVGRLSP